MDPPLLLGAGNFALGARSHPECARSGNARRTFLFLAPGLGAFDALTSTHARRPARVDPTERGRRATGERAPTAQALIIAQELSSPTAELEVRAETRRCFLTRVLDGTRARTFDAAHERSDRLIRRLAKRAVA